MRATGSFDPFRRLEFDRRNEEICSQEQQSMIACEPTQRYGLAEKRAGRICWAVRKKGVW